jgi:hypothetical protein
VSHDTVVSWSSGRRRAPDGVIDELADLYARIHGLSIDIMRRVAAMAARDVDPDDRIICTMTDEQAQARGWPCAGPANAAVGIAIALSEHDFTVEPL